MFLVYRQRRASALGGAGLRVLSDGGRAGVVPPEVWHQQRYQQRCGIDKQVSLTEGEGRCGTTKGTKDVASTTVRYQQRSVSDRRRGQVYGADMFEGMRGGEVEEVEYDSR